MKQRTIYRVTEEWMKLRINDLEYKEAKHSQSEQEQNRIQNKEDSVSSFWDNFKRSNSCIIRVLLGEEKEQDIGNLLEKIVKENSNLAKEIDMKVQGAQRVPIKLDPKRTTPRHIIIKMLRVKNKERILKVPREKLVIYRGVPIRISANSSKEKAG